MNRIYLDWNATAPLDPRVLERMLPYLRQHAGNPSSLHEEGREARRAVEDAREIVAGGLGAEPREIIFCSGATEANNLALRGLAHARKGPIVVSAIEHPSILECAAALEREGSDVLTLPVTSAGVVDVAALRASLDRGPSVVAVMAANNETGVVQPIAEIAAACRAREAPLHVDAVQALGRIAGPLLQDGVVTASISAHKIGGPKGIGALWLKSETRIEPAIVGGGQERGRRAGTENVAAIVGFGAAVALVCAEIDGRRARLRTLEARFLQALAARKVAFVVHGALEGGARIPGTLNIGFPGFSGEGMLFGLDLLGISVSLGSACSSGAAKPSHVLAAMGISKQENVESVRFSMGPALSELDVENVADSVAKVLRRGASGA